jgi:hypothetical protein
MILGLFIWLATRWISSKTKAKDKLVMIFLLALVMVLLIPLLEGVLSLVFGYIGDAVNWPARQLTFLGGTANFLGALVGIIIFLVFMVFVKLFINETWTNSVWIALLSLFLLYLLYTLIPVLYTSLSNYLPWIS